MHVNNGKLVPFVSFRYRCADLIVDNIEVVRQRERQVYIGPIAIA